MPFNFDGETQQLEEDDNPPESPAGDDNTQEAPAADDNTQEVPTVDDNTQEVPANDDDNPDDINLIPEEEDLTGMFISSRPV